MKGKKRPREFCCPQNYPPNNKIENPDTSKCFSLCELAPISVKADWRQGRRRRGLSAPLYWEQWEEATPAHSFTSSPLSWDSHLHLILLQYSGDTGDAGSWLEQQRRPSSAEGTRAPFPWALQNECGQNSQKETATLPHSSHRCHGHSHFPNAGVGRRGKYLLADFLITHQKPKRYPLPFLETKSHCVAWLLCHLFPKC